MFFLQVMGSVSAKVAGYFCFIFCLLIVFKKRLYTSIAFKTVSSKNILWIMLLKIIYATKIKVSHNLVFKKI